MRKYLLASTLIAITPFAFIFALIVFLSSYGRTQHFAINNETAVYAALPGTRDTLSAIITENDGKNAEKIRAFLAKYNSPLEPYAVDLVDAADQYGLDRRLLVGIAMQESTLCKKIPVNSYNCWGFGIYGTKVTRFADFREGIYTVSKALATKYKTRGLVTPNQIMTMYTPGSNGSWAKGVNHTMGQLQ